MSRQTAIGLLALSLVVAAPAVAAADQGSSARKPLVSELRLGVLAHDVGVFSSNKEGGVDVNAEVLFRDLGWFGKRVALRPHLGASINTGGDTSQLYFGLTSTLPLWHWGFFELSFGGSAHNGETDANIIGRKDLGCHLLFRESVSAGIYLNEHSSIAVVADHISNANICSKNEGLETVGVRYGYRF